MKILFACGGTAGHINPALAVAGALQKRHPGIQIKFAGNPNGMEARLVPAAGYDFLPIEILGIQRKINWRNIRYNFRSVYLLARAPGRVKKIIKSFEPDVVVGTGGYVSGPVLRTAHKMGIKTLTHEQNAYPGITTRLLAATADKVLLADEEAKTRLPKGRDYIVTGNPIREDILFADRAQARQELGVGQRVCILSFGGSLGAARLNEAVADVMAWHSKSGKARVHHIHATGSYGVEDMPRLLKEKGADYHQNPHLDIREYINDMPRCLAAADLVIGRAGAITLSELQAAGRASILIPSPNVAENHQYHNAMVLARQDAAVVIEESKLTGPLLVQTVKDLVEDPARLAVLGANAQRMAIVDAAQRICRQIELLLPQ